MNQNARLFFGIVLFANLALAATPTMVRDWTHPRANDFFKKCGAPQNISVYKFNSCQGSPARIKSGAYQLCYSKNVTYEMFSFFRCAEKSSEPAGYNISLIQTAPEADFAVSELRRISKNQKAAKRMEASEDTERVILEIRGKFPNHNSP